MKEADISRQIIAQATNELIEKCEVISVKFEETNTELANKQQHWKTRLTRTMKSTVSMQMVTYSK